MGLRPVRIDCRNFTDGSKTHLAVSSRAVTTEPSPPAIGGQSSMAVTNASPETSSSGRLNGSIRPTQMPLRRIHERGRMISASTMPPSLPSAVIDSLAQVAWLGSGCGSTSERLGFLVGTRAPIGTDSMGTWRKLGDCPRVCMRVRKLGDCPRVCMRVN
jgi:hypothetical protein